jgi:shikimate kinase
MLEKRTPVYARLADFSINTATMGMDEVVNEIFRFLHT